MTNGTVYLIHIEPEVAGRRHYLGFTRGSALARVYAHAASDFGTRFLREARERGIDAKLTIVRQWLGKTPDFEKQLKREKNLRRHCVICLNLESGEMDQVSMAGGPGLAPRNAG